MMPDRIGIIGSTHGVKASPRPVTKKNASTPSRLPVRTRSAIESCSDRAWVAVLVVEPSAGPARAALIGASATDTCLRIGG
jgi:hypothetical protein